MSISGIGQNYYQNNVSTNKHNKSRVGQFYPQKQAAEVSAPQDTRPNANVQDIYEALKSTNPLLEQEDNDVSDEELEQVDKQESESKTEIIVKPDGSRVLVMTMSIGGMETTMSLEISKPTEAPTENAKQDTNNTPMAENDTVSDEMSNIFIL
ncbi:hypothetical protein C806_03792 [Lachnospiraceae bacterium 3-1]|nr:hypothetical protein C806_03792 [Lachnospiraceae bacterium 3-1]